MTNVPAKYAPIVDAIKADVPGLVVAVVSCGREGREVSVGNFETKRVAHIAKFFGRKATATQDGDGIWYEATMGDVPNLVAYLLGESDTP